MLGLPCCAVPGLGMELFAVRVMLHWAMLSDGEADGAVLTLVEPSLCPAAIGFVPLCWSEVPFCLYSWESIVIQMPKRRHGHFQQNSHPASPAHPRSRGISLQEEGEGDIFCVKSSFLGYCSKIYKEAWNTTWITALKGLLLFFLWPNQVQGGNFQPRSISHYGVDIAVIARNKGQHLQRRQALNIDFPRRFYLQNGN